MVLVRPSASDRKQAKALGEARFSAARVGNFIRSSGKKMGVVQGQLKLAKTRYHQARHLCLQFAKLFPGCVHAAAARALPHSCVAKAAKAKAKGKGKGKQLALPAPVPLALVDREACREADASAPHLTRDRVTVPEGGALGRTATVPQLGSRLGRMPRWAPRGWRVRGPGVPVTLPVIRHDSLHIPFSELFPVPNGAADLKYVRSAQFPWGLLWPTCVGYKHCPAESEGYKYLQRMFDTGFIAIEPARLVCILGPNCQPEAKFEFCSMNERTAGIVIVGHEAAKVAIRLVLLEKMQ